MQNAPPVVRQHQNHIQDLEADRRHRKKVNGNHGFHVVVQEGPPGLGGRLVTAHQVLAHTRLANINAQLEQLAVNPRSARRVEETRCTLDFPWLYPPFPASCPFRSILAHRGLPPHRTTPCRFPAAGSSSAGTTSPQGSSPGSRPIVGRVLGT